MSEKTARKESGWPSKKLVAWLGLVALLFSVIGALSAASFKAVRASTTATHYLEKIDDLDRSDDAQNRALDSLRVTTKELARADSLFMRDHAALTIEQQKTRDLLTCYIRHQAEGRSPLACIQ